MNEFILKYGGKGLWYGTFTHFIAQGIKHGVSTRLGGVSHGPFTSLNLALHTGDNAKEVILNRKNFCKVLGMEFSRIVTAQQVHGSHIAVVTDQHIGRGREDYATSLEGTDALITNVPNVPLMLFFADCVPVLIADPVHHAVGISHAGWKGTVNKIAQKTVLAMRDQFSTNPEDCLIGIAPSIGVCCYEVDDVVVNHLKDNFTVWQDIITPHKNRWMLNLWLANRLQLEEVGVLPSNIVTSGVCTSCNTNVFFSYRGDKGLTGRIAAVISL